MKAFSGQFKQTGCIQGCPKMYVDAVACPSLVELS